MSQVFISYSHNKKDNEFVEQLSQSLKEFGFEAWWDKKLKAGDKWSHKIEVAISASKYLVVVLSKESIKSDWVENECTYAMNLNAKNLKNNIKIIPILLEACKIPIALNNIQHIDAKHKGMKDVVSELISSFDPDNDLSIAETPKQTGETERPSPESLPPAQRKLPGNYVRLIFAACILGIIIIFYFIITALPPVKPSIDTPTAVIRLTSTPTGREYTITFKTGEIPDDGQVHNVYYSLDGGEEQLLFPAGKRVNNTFYRSFSRSIRVRVDLQPGTYLHEELLVNGEDISGDYDYTGIFYQLPGQ